ncbi:MAG: transglutaminase domain-containing protein [Spirochaetales bacterium]|nr:transglutaminase domain-containing protein [Spirochaetales bacterium]
MSFNRRNIVSLLGAAALFLLFIPLQLYLKEIISPWFSIPVFIFAAAAGVFFEKYGFKLVPSLLFIFLVVLAVRLIVGSLMAALSGYTEKALFDYIFLNFDSAFFPFLPVTIYVAFFTFYERRKAGFMTVEVIVNAVLFVFILWSQGKYNLTLFEHPGVIVCYSIVFILLEIAIILFSSGYEKDGGKKIIAISAFFIPVFILCALLFFNFYSSGASQDKGGLVKPTLFSFDFSDYIKLEPEISMDHDLVLLMRNYGYLNSVYLRRFYLSGYKPSRGFYIQKGPGEEPQTLSIPERSMTIDSTESSQRIDVKQDYFIVNFDPSSLIAMNYPVSVTPLTNWNDSSFLRNYSVVSRTVEQPSWELPEEPVLEMEPRLKKFYTEYGNNEKIKELAEEITEGLENPYDIATAIMFYLQDNYYYSLKPGVATNGDQLDYFLFDSKKGYCSYFAFSMALMCRSLGIPARVAAGFFIDPRSGVLNVYPVREDMAHAWVEIPFKDFGWVEFDPTSEQIAPGEELQMAPLDGSEYSNLIEEIFANKYGIENNEPVDDSSNPASGLSSVVKKIGRFIKLNPVLFSFCIYFFALLVFYISAAIKQRIGSTSKRVKACYRNALRLVTACGIKKSRSESILEHAKRSADNGFSDFLPIAELYLETVFSNHTSKITKADITAANKKFYKSFHQTPFIKRALIFLFPFLRFRAKNAVLICVFLLSLSFMTAPALYAQSSTSGTDNGASYYLEEAEKEKAFENYEGALQILQEGIEKNPESWELKFSAGEIYSEKELFNLAVQEYEEALDISPDNIEVLYSKSKAEGRLNLDNQSISSLEKIISIDPEDFDAIADLGWMYFKTFRLKEAEKLLVGAIEHYNDSPILYMTLGTIYSGMYNYEKSSFYYLKSIELAHDLGWGYLVSVSSYNLSLLEYSFYNYEKSFEYTNKSIEAEERAPGFISRAEIYQAKLDFSSALANYQRAFVLDSTPLALMGLADLYANFGKMDEALSYINEVLKYDDESWMYYFGIDPARHRMETDRLLEEIYSGLSNREKFSPKFGVKKLKSVFNTIYYKVLAWYYHRRYYAASFTLGDMNAENGNELDASMNYYNALSGYKRRALKYLTAARNIETKNAPKAEASYLFEEGRLMKDRSKLLEAVSMFDPEWEANGLADAYVELYKLDKDPLYAEALYQLNPGAFIREGLKFPLELDFKPGFLLGLKLRFSGFDISIKPKASHYRYKLSFSGKDDGICKYKLIDNKTMSELFSISAIDKRNSPKIITELMIELKKGLFFTTNG